MRVLLIAYDLNQEVKRPPIVKFIKASWPWAMLSESSYAIHTAETPEQVYARLRQFVDGNDQMYVATLSRPIAGQGFQAQNEWLRRFVLGQFPRAA